MALLRQRHHICVHRLLPLPGRNNMKELTRTHHLFSSIGNRLPYGKYSTYASLLLSTVASRGNDDGPGN